MLNFTRSVIKLATHDETWLYYYNLLKKFKKQYGHLNIPVRFKTFDGINFDPEGTALGNWARYQTKYLQTGEIKPNRKIALELIEFPCKKREKTNQIVNKRTLIWEDMYNIAKNYFQEKGNLTIQTNFRTLNGITYDENGKLLDRWVRAQKQLYEKGKLSEEKINKLTQIGFILDIHKHSKEAEKICNKYKIYGTKTILLLKKLPLEELEIKMNYLRENNLPITNHQGVHEIFFMSQKNIKAKYGLDLKNTYKKDK